MNFVDGISVKTVVVTIETSRDVGVGGPTVVDAVDGVSVDVGGGVSVNDVSAVIAVV